MIPYQVVGARVVMTQAIGGTLLAPTVAYDSPLAWEGLAPQHRAAILWHMEQRLLQRLESALGLPDSGLATNPLHTELSAALWSVR